MDMTSAVLFTELAPWSSLVQRFGALQPRGEVDGDGGAGARRSTSSRCSSRGLRGGRMTAAGEILAWISDAPPPPAKGAARPLTETGDPRQGFRAVVRIRHRPVTLRPRCLALYPGYRHTAVAYSRGQPAGGCASPRRAPGATNCSAPLGRELAAWLKAPREGKPDRVYVEDPNGDDRRSGGKPVGCVWTGAGRPGPGSCCSSMSNRWL